MPKTIGVVTARGGSQRFPGKNIESLAGKPMIAWTFEAALAAERLDRIIVSTDDPEIARIARAWGVEVPFLRPTALAQDDSEQIDVVRHSLDWLESDHSLPDYVFLLQPTSPLRTSADIDAAVQIAEERDAQAVIGLTRTKPHPYRTKRIQEDGSLANFIPGDLPQGLPQNYPTAYAVTGAVYVNKCAALRAHRTFYPKGALPYFMPPERAIDVDTRLDLILVEHLLRQRHAS